MEVTYKMPMLKIKAKPIFWLLGSFKDGIWFIGNAMMMRSVMMAKLAVEYQISPTWMQWPGSCGLKAFSSGSHWTIDAIMTERPKSITATIVVHEATRNHVEGNIRRKRRRMETFVRVVAALKRT